MKRPPNLILSTAPFLHTQLTTPQIMREVLLSLIPISLVACWYFGLGVLLVIAAATLGAFLTEWAFGGRERSTLSDYSALLTGALLGLTLPPQIPLWMAGLGGAVAIGLGKLVWGGLGQNLFNPALVGRAFLQAAFPTAISTWSSPVAGDLWRLPSSLFAPPLFRGAVDGVSAATPLGLAKFSGETTAVGSLLLGNVSGSIGETSAAVLILCGLWLGLRRTFDWRLPASTLLSTAVCSGLFHYWQPLRFPSPSFMLLSGGLLFAAVYMVTDPVTTPTTSRGAWLFGFGVGLLVVLIRLFGGLAEGIMYAILLMNAVTPYINRYGQPRRYGG